MTRFANYSDDFYINMHLNTEMDLPTQRDTVLHFLEQVQKRYPTLRNFAGRERNEVVLEEDKDRGCYRWIALEPKRLSAGQVNPQTVEEALELHRMVLDLAPHMLSVSPIDCESLNVMFCFDFTFRGNHNQLIADALGLSPAFERFAETPGAKLLSFEPSLVLALDDDCRTQARVNFETRTSPFHIKSGEFAEDQLTVYLATRRVGGLDPGENYVEVFDRLVTSCQELADSFLIEAVLRPLQKTIAMR